MSGEERTEMFSKPLEQQEYDRQAAIDDAELNQAYSDSVLHWRTRALDLESRLAVATALADARAAEIQEYREALLVREHFKRAHPTQADFVTCRLCDQVGNQDEPLVHNADCLLAREPDVRGASVLDLARKVVEPDPALLDHLARIAYEAWHLWFRRQEVERGTRMANDVHPWSRYEGNDDFKAPFIDQVRAVILALPLGLAAPTPGTEPTDPPWVKRGFGGLAPEIGGRQWATCTGCAWLTIYPHGQGNFPGRLIEHEDDCEHNPKRVES